MVDICQVSKRYGRVQALTDVSLHVREGSVLGLLGQNGAGKTTLLNLITGYLAPTEGQVLIDGFDPLTEPEEAKRHLGYLPEHPPLYDEMTVEEYLSFVSCLRGMDKRAVSAHVGEVMEQTGLTDVRRRVLSHLSKGYRQRAGMAQALCGNPKVLILDEPTVGLDPKQITEIRALIRSLAKGRTILFSSHILSEVQQLCDHVVILHKGRVKLNTPMAQAEDGEEITLKCTIAAAEKEVLPMLRKLNGVRRVNVEAAENAEGTSVEMTFQGEKEPEKALFGLLSTQSLPILRLDRCRDTLEQVFLKTISEE